MNYVKKLNLHCFCTQNHILEPFSVRRACTKSYVTSEPYPRASQIWCQNVRETWKKKVIKCRGESFARCRVIARNGEGGPKAPPPPVFLGLMPFWLSTDDISHYTAIQGWKHTPKYKQTKLSCVVIISHKRNMKLNDYFHKTMCHHITIKQPSV